MAKRRLTLEEMGEAAYQFASGQTYAEVASNYGLNERAFKTQHGEYWDRWHALRDIKEARALSSEENAEYSEMEKTAGRIDKREAARCKKAMEPFMKRHGRIIAKGYSLLNRLKEDLAKIE